MTLDWFRSNAVTLIIFIIGCTSFIILQTQFSNFALDDAYIGYRYSENLANGDGISWNVGEDPVEGFTSFLWVVLNAGAIKLNLNPNTFSNGLSMISALAIILILSLRSRKIPWSFQMVIIASVAMNPGFVFLSMLGMETILTTLIVLLFATISITLYSKWSQKLSLLLHTLTILALLSRPDMAPFLLGSYIGISGVLVVEKRFKHLRMLYLTSIPFIIFGLGYMYWRIQYFGFPLPNTFYRKFVLSGPFLPIELKSAFPNTLLPGLSYVLNFISSLMLPYIPIVLIGLSLLRKQIKLRPLLPVIIGSMCFLAFVLFTRPIQGFFWRFIIPIWPVFLIILTDIIKNSSLNSYEYSKKVIPALTLAVFFVLWPLHYYNDAVFLHRFLNLKDRILVGKAISDLSGKMFVTDSGVIPYFSKWHTVDYLGLNSEEIAHNGLSVNLLTKFNPDLVMLSMKNSPQGWNDFPIVHKYLNSNQFTVVAAIKKNTRRIHLYLARNDSDLFYGIIDRISKIENLTYVDPKSMLKPHDKIDAL